MIDLVIKAFKDEVDKYKDLAKYGPQKQFEKLGKDWSELGEDIIKYFNSLFSQNLSFSYVDIQMMIDRAFEFGILTQGKFQNSGMFLITIKGRGITINNLNSITFLARRINIPGLRREVKQVRSNYIYNDYNVDNLLNELDRISISSKSVYEVEKNVNIDNTMFLNSINLIGNRYNFNVIFNNVGGYDYSDNSISIGCFLTETQLLHYNLLQIFRNEEVVENKYDISVYLLNQVRLPIWSMSFLNCKIVEIGNIDLSMDNNDFINIDYKFSFEYIEYKSLNKDFFTDYINILKEVLI